MPRIARQIVVLLALPAIGCTHGQLRYSSTRQGGTLTDIQYKQVLDNLAMFVANPDALPYFATAGSGSTQITDTTGLNALTWNWHPFSGVATLLGTRGIVEQWGLAPVLEPDRLKAMRCAYRLVLNVPSDRCDDCGQELTKFLGSPIDMNCRFPRGWFCSGGWCDAPKGVYHGHYRTTHVWVPPEGTEGLTQFTLTILTIASAVPAAPQMYTQEKYIYSHGRLDTKETRQVREPPDVTAGNELPPPSPAPQMYIIPRVAPSIQFFPQAR